MESYFSSPFLLPKLLIVKTLYKKFVYFKQNYYICYLNSVAGTAAMDREHSERIRMWSYDCFVVTMRTCSQSNKKTKTLEDAFE